MLSRIRRYDEESIARIPAIASGGSYERTRSNCTEYSFDLLAAGVSGDLAYTVGFEHSVVAVDDGPAVRGKLRVTHIYRRENGEWKIVHRHGDHPPVDESPTTDPPKTVRYTAS